MENMKILLPILVLLTVFSCKKPAKPEFRKMTNVKFGSLIMDKGVSVNMTGNAVLFNPNSIGVPISGMDFDLYAEGKKVSRITQDVTAKIPSNSEFTLPLSFTIPLEEVFKGFRPKIKDLMKKRTVKIKVDGHLIVQPAGVDFKIPITYEDEHEVELKDFINF